MSTLAVAERAADRAQKLADALRDVVDELKASEQVFSAFRSQSGARVAAVLLVDHPGQWWSRAELAEAAGVPGSTIPRVVTKLREAGVQVERMTLPDRTACYRVPAGVSR